MTTAKFGKADLRTINAALCGAIDWEASLAEANEHIPVERNKCLARIRRYGKLKQKILSALNLKYVDPLAGAKLVTLAELRESQEKNR